MRSFCMSRDIFASALGGSILVMLASPAAMACSGPGAMQTIRNSELIGTLLGAIAIAIVVVACRLIRRWHPGARVRWVVAPLVLHPRLWMNAAGGDCGSGLVAGSLAGTVAIVIVAGLGLCWPRSGAGKGRWILAGAIAGGLAGFPIGFMVLLEQAHQSLALALLLALSAPMGAILVGGLAGGGLFQLHSGGDRRFTCRLRTMLLLPVAMGLLMLPLLPVLPCRWSTSTTSPFRFIVVDATTGRPVPGAEIRIGEPNSAPDDIEHQGIRFSTDSAGSTEAYLYANVEGRQGLLGFRETSTSYNPQMVRVKARGYRPFCTSISAEPPVSADQLTDPPLALPFPPPPSATIRLTPLPAAGRVGKPGEAAASPRAMTAGRGAGGELAQGRPRPLFRG